MNTMLMLGGAAFAGGLGTAAIGLGRASAAQAGSQELLAMVRDEDAPTSGGQFAEPFVLRLLGPGWQGLERVARSLTPGWWFERMRRNATYAGLASWGMDGLLAMKGLFALAGLTLVPLVAALTGRSFGRAVVWALAGGIIAFFLPDVWIAHRAERRQDAIRRTLPEALDLMAIAVAAGVGLEGSIAIVAQRLPGPLGEELNRLLREVQLGASRREALHNLRRRTDVAELGTFALALAQADQLGSPLAEVLRVQASEMRMLRRQRAREAAAKTPVKLLMPLLLGIFPALMVVILGPAIIQISRMFG